MRNILLYISLLFTVTYLACRKSESGDSGPCAGLQTDTSLLAPVWKWRSDTLLRDVYPEVFGNQIVIIQRTGPAMGSQLTGIDATSGDSLWRVTVPAYIDTNFYRRNERELFFTNPDGTELLGFNPATQQVRAVWTQPVQGLVYHLARDFAVQGNTGVCLAIHSVDIDSAEVVVYLIDLQSGNSRVAFSYFTSSTTFGIPEWYDQQLQISPAGDTVFSYIEVYHDPQQARDLSRFSSLNLHTGSLIHGEPSTSLYQGQHHNLILDGDRAYFPLGDILYCLRVADGTVIWKASGLQFTDLGPSMALRNGQLLVINFNDIQSLNPDNGNIRWSHQRTGHGSDLRNIFGHQGRLFLVEDDALVGLDEATGCITDEHHVTPILDDGLYSGLAFSQDRNTAIVVGHRHLFGVPLKQ